MLTDPSPPTLADEIAALLRAGCVVEFAPVVGALGVVYATVGISPPGVARSLADEIAAVRSGAPVSVPVVHTFHLVYEMDALAAWMRQARVLLIARG